MPVRVPFVDWARDFGIINRAWNDSLQADWLQLALSIRQFLLNFAAANPSATPE